MDNEFKDNVEAKSFFNGVLLATVIYVVLFCGTGAFFDLQPRLSIIDKIQKEAINAHAGEFIINDKQEKEFRWLPQTTKK